MRERWHPTGGSFLWPPQIKAGMVVAIDHPGYRHKPWRVHEVRCREGDDRLYVTFRPDGEAFDFAQHNTSLSIAKHASLTELPEHYAVCHKCGELPPCSEVWTERISEAATEYYARFEVEGICPSCQEPVTARQKSHRFDVNLHVPIGPPVTFHARRACLGAAIEYDKTLAKRTKREPTLSCTGLLTRHLDRAEECTNVTCPAHRPISWPAGVRSAPGITRHGLTRCSG